MPKHKEESHRHEFHGQPEMYEFLYYFSSLGMALLRCKDCGENLMVNATDYGKDESF